jgi:hypothetical protein
MFTFKNIILLKKEEKMIVRNVVMVNITSMNDLPLMERWVQRDHCAETIGAIGCYLVRYMSYRAVTPPPQMYNLVESYGYYNWRVTELWMDPANMPAGGGHLTTMTAHDPAITEKPYPFARGSFPTTPTQTFRHLDGPYDSKNILRWVSFMKYPKGVPVEEGEKWFLDVHSKEVAQQPGLTCYFSSKAISSPGRPPEYIRLNELWYEDFSSWKKAIVDTPPKYTKPSWAKYDKYPFLEPYVDFCSTFILEKPTNNFLRDYNGYILGF